MPNGQQDHHIGINMTNPYGGGTFGGAPSNPAPGSGVSGNQFSGTPKQLPINESAGYYKGLLDADKKWGPKYGAAYSNYNKAHPEHTAYENLMAFLSEIIAKGLGKVITETTQLIAKVPQAAAEGAAKAIDVLGGFNLSSWFMRIGEILLGIVLVGVGVARITGVQNAVSQIVKTKVPIPI